MTKSYFLSIIIVLFCSIKSFTASYNTLPQQLYTIGNYGDYNVYMLVIENKFNYSIPDKCISWFYIGYDIDRLNRISTYEIKKYKEWKKIAIENKVDNLQKKIIDYKVQTYDINKSWISTEDEKFDWIFLVVDGECYLCADLFSLNAEQIDILENIMTKNEKVQQMQKEALTIIEEKIDRQKEEKAKLDLFK